MRGSSYHERDFAFGRTMLTVRTRIGLTQAGLAETLGISRKAVADWEGGNSYPQTDHLKQVIVLAIQHQALTAGRMVEEAHALWHSAHQKVLLDDVWLSTLLPPAEVSPSLYPDKETSAAAVCPQRLDWNAAPASTSFYGRERELDLLSRWVIIEQCRVVSVLGLGGIGKSALAVSLMHRLADHFRAVIWRSADAYSNDADLLGDPLHKLSPQMPREEPGSLDQRHDGMLGYLRNTRILLVVDNLEAVLEEEQGAGKMRPGFEELERFLRQAAVTDHQSCVLLTSREKPVVLVPLEGPQAPARAIRLAPLDAVSCSRLLAENKLSGRAEDRTQLIEAYSGNPLALKIAAQTILDLFAGEIAPFLNQGEPIFGGVRDVLDEQFSRLSRLEQNLLLALAILHMPASLDDLFIALAAPIDRASLLEAMDNLYRHSLIEHGDRPGTFTLQAMVREYLTARLITTDDRRNREGNIDRLLEQDNAREDIR